MGVPKYAYDSSNQFHLTQEILLLTISILILLYTLLSTVFTCLHEIEFDNRNLLEREKSAARYVQKYTLQKSTISFAVLDRPRLGNDSRHI